MTFDADKLRALDADTKPSGITDPTAREFAAEIVRRSKAAEDLADYLLNSVPAILAMAEEIKELRECLGFWAARQTCEEALFDKTPAPWRDCSPEQRLKIIAARKDLHDGEVLKARRALGKDKA